MPARAPLDVLIIGAGIGGLAAAAGLARDGHRVTVAERRAGAAAAAADAGTGLSLWPNAFAALADLGIGLPDPAEQPGATEPAGTGHLVGGFRDHRGRWLLRTAGDAVRKRYGRLDVLHRGALATRLDAAARQHGAEVLRGRAAAVTDARAGVVEIGGVERRAHLVVAADGIGSHTRAAFWPASATPRSARETAWRFVVEVTPAERAVGVWGGEVLGRGLRVGLAPLGDGRAYVYVTRRHGRDWAGVAGAAEPLAVAPLPDLAAFPAPIPALAERAERDARVVVGELAEGPRLRSFAHGRVMLLGDAAHTTTPNLGQGACLAVEDAAVLARLARDAAHASALRAGDPHPLARAYDAARVRRTRRIVRESWLAGRVLTVRHPIAAAVRDAALRAMPASLALRGLGPIASWRPDGGGTA